MNDSEIRKEVLDIYNKLISGEISREEATDWAMVFINNDLFVDDRVSWANIMKIAASDATGLESEYLYDETDFEDWLEEYKAAIG